MSAARRASPAISVLLPARNARRWIRHSVGDVLAQREVDLELIVVDDHSTDRTGEWLREAADSDPRLRVLEAQDQGVAAALNQALSCARAARIGHMEADDRTPHDRFARLLAHLDARPELDGVVSRVGLTGFRSDGMRRYLDWQNGVLSTEQLRRERFIEIPAMQQTGLYRRTLLEGMGGFRDDPRWPFDIDFWMRALGGGADIEKLPRVLYRWRQHERQSTRTSPRHRNVALRRCKAHFFLAGPAGGRPIDLVSIGATLTGWSEALEEQGCEDVRATPWRPGHGPAPERRPGAVRLFVYGRAQVRDRIVTLVPDLDPAHDWFAA